MAETSGSWSLEDLLEEVDLTQASSGRLAEHSGRMLPEESPSGFVTRFQGSGASSSGTGSDILKVLKSSSGDGSSDCPESVGRNASGRGVQGFGEDLRNGMRQPGHGPGNESQATWEGLHTGSDSQDKRGSGIRLQSSAVGGSIDKEWDRVNGPNPVGTLSRNGLKQVARLVVAFMLFLGDVVMGLVTAGTHCWHFMRQPSRESFRMWLAVVILAIKEGTADTVNSLGVCGSRICQALIFLHRRIKIWALVYGEQLPKPVQEPVKQLAQTGANAVKRCEKVLDGVYTWGQSRLHG
jgi:hypothetical protein